MGILNIFCKFIRVKKKENKKECHIPRAPWAIRIKAYVKEVQYQRSWIERYLVEPLRAFGYDIVKPNNIKCYGDKWNCFYEKKRLAYIALTEYRFKDSAKLVGECLTLLDQIWNDIWRDICRE